MSNKIGVYICHCGNNISEYVDVEKVKDSIENEKGVHIARTTMFACADSAQTEIIDDIKNNELDGIVIASCSPKLHLQTFREVAKRAGLNPYNYVQVNIREQGSWAHSDDPEGATEKAISLVKAGIGRTRFSKSLEHFTIPAKNSVLIIGAGIAGMRAAIELAEMGTRVYLIEREHFVGGRLSQWGVLCSLNETGKELISRIYRRLKELDNITLFTGAEVISKAGSSGNFEVEIKITPRYVKTKCDPEGLKKAIEACPIEVPDEFNFYLTNRKAIFKNFDSEFPEAPVINMDDCNRCGECLQHCDSIDLDQKTEIIKLEIGAIQVCTGFDPYEPKEGEFGYKTIDNVITLQQLKRLVELNDKQLIYNGNQIHNIAFIYCVGSRQFGKINGNNQYCSRYCCTVAIHSSIIVGKKYNDITCQHFTRGVRTYGKQELIYDEASQKGDIFFHFDENSPPTVEKSGDKTIVKVNDVYTDQIELGVEADLVVLVSGMIPRKDNSVVSILKTPVGRDGFLNEIHPKLRPVETVIDGVFISGAAQGPKNIEETVNSTLSAASKVNALICKEEIKLEPTIATINEETCEWCGKCLEACPFGAIEQITHNGKQIASVIETNCKGCGICTPVCPVDAIELIGYTNVEIESMIIELAK